MFQFSSAFKYYNSVTICPLYTLHRSHETAQIYNQLNQASWVISSPAGSKVYQETSGYSQQLSVQVDRQMLTISLFNFCSWTKLRMKLKFTQCSFSVGLADIFTAWQQVRLYERLSFCSKTQDTRFTARAFVK